jgi:Leucine-rich repeat (LRR) protein
MCLDSNNIERIEPLFLCSFPSLKAISLFNNQIDKCPSTSELGKCLEAVNLSMNAIRSLDGAFSSLTNMNSTLREIILSNNKLVHIEINAFTSLKALNSLELNNCQIERLEPGCFQGIVKLERLDLSNNSFTSIDSGLFAELINLKVIKLSECKNLSYIDPEAFPEFNQQVRVQITTGKELLSELAIRNVLIGI